MCWALSGWPERVEVRIQAPAQSVVPLVPVRVSHLSSFFPPSPHAWASQGSSEGTGLSALLPQPKNLTVKETNRLLLPHAFSRKPSDGSSDPKSSRQASKIKPASLAPVVGTTTTTPSPSAIKAAAKSAALQVTRQITQEEDDSDEEVAPENFFSLPDKAEPPGVEPYPYPLPPAPEELPPGTEPEPAFQDDAANAPLEFKMGAGSSGAPWVPKPGEDYSYNQFSTYGDANAAGAYYQVRRRPEGSLPVRERPQPLEMPSRALLWSEG